jgi:chromosome segregation ATPase
MSAEEPGQRTGGGSRPTDARIRQLDEELEATGQQRDQIARELRAAKEEIGVKDAYITSLEADLDSLSARLDGFPQVRVKVWLSRLRRRTGR